MVPRWFHGLGLSTTRRRTLLLPTKFLENQRTLRAGIFDERLEQRLQNSTKDFADDTCKSESDGVSVLYPNTGGV